MYLLFVIFFFKYFFQLTNYDMWEENQFFIRWIINVKYVEGIKLIPKCLISLIPLFQFGKIILVIRWWDGYVGHIFTYRGITLQKTVLLQPKQGHGVLGWSLHRLRAATSDGLRDCFQRVAMVTEWSWALASAWYGY